jgi:hypothetical protein
MVDDTVLAGVEAWRRIRESGRRSWGDWLAVARALAKGRAEAMQAAKANRPFGKRYNAAMGAWLADNGLDGIDNQQRYRALLCLENLPAISAWRDGLPEAKRRTMNHPAACWHAWRRSAAEGGPAVPRRAPVKAASGNGNARRELAPALVELGVGGNGGGYTRPIFWGGEAIRRAANAIRESYSTDFFVMARRALEAAVRDESDVNELLGPRRVHAQKANGANHVAG